MRLLCSHAAPPAYRLVFLGALLLAGCQKPAPVPAEPTAKKGAALFRDMACSTCHHSGAVGGTLEGVTARRNAVWFDTYLKNPAAVHPDSTMPSFDMPAGDVAALWAYLEWKDANPAKD